QFASGFRIQGEGVARGASTGVDRIAAPGVHTLEQYAGVRMALGRDRQADVKYLVTGVDPVRYRARGCLAWRGRGLCTEACDRHFNYQHTCLLRRWRPAVIGENDQAGSQTRSAVERFPRFCTDLYRLNLRQAQEKFGTSIERFQPGAATHVARK